MIKLFLGSPISGCLWGSLRVWTLCRFLLKLPTHVCQAGQGEGPILPSCGVLCLTCCFSSVQRICFFEKGRALINLPPTPKNTEALSGHHCLKWNSPGCGGDLYNLILLDFECQIFRVNNTLKKKKKLGGKEKFSLSQPSCCGLGTFYFKMCKITKMQSYAKYSVPSHIPAFEF